MVLLFINILLSKFSSAQTQADVTMSTAYSTPGIITATHSITLEPNFSYNGINGQLVFKIFEPIPNSLSFNTAPSNENYIWTKTPRVPITDPSTLNTKPTDQVMQAIQYFDGLGRPMQTIQIKGNHDATKDVIQPIGYDDYGRESAKYLPYAEGINTVGSYRPNALSGDQGNFYYAPPTGVSANLSPYSQTVYEPSPENRVIEQGASGSNWQPSNGHTQKVVYTVNEANSVRYYVAANNPTSGLEYARTLVLNGNYAAGELYLTITKDENWVSANGKSGTIEEYKNNEGKVVLKRYYKTGSIALSTYYVYDYKGNLTYVLPPGANPDVESVNAAALTNFCYQYYYDGRDRLIEKKLPGKDWEYMVYNSGNQVVLTQDGLQRANSQWLYTKYDELGRPVITGIYSSTYTRAQEQTTVDAQFSLSEARDNTTTIGYTNNLSYPDSNNGTLLTVNYYDDYNFPNASAVANQNTYSNSGLSLQTGTLIYKTDGSTPLLTANYYDDEARITENVRQNNLSGIDRVINTYSFTGQVLSSTLNHTVGSQSITVAKTYLYDHMDRKRETKEQINGGANVVLSKIDLNDIGQPYVKHMHSEDDAVSFLQDVSYTYNERGWLRTANTSSNIFNLELRYDNPDAGTANFNGNISQMLYNTTKSVNPGQRKFTYAYDPLNRLTSATSNTGDMDETISYNPNADDMGNFVSLTRTGPGAASLSYVYQDGSGNASNQLFSVAKNGNSFRNYNYDANGNAGSNGDVTNPKSITYNILNLPQTIQQNGNTIATYTYDATGAKLKNTGSDGTWDYDGEIVYKNNAIAFIQTEEGKAQPDGSGGYNYVYDLKDHLGNVRVTFRKYNGAADVVQEDEYYTFGLRKPGYDNSNGNRYLYNGKEIQSDLTDQYDYGARFYDPVIGRWSALDPLAEKDRRWSPYNYASDNSINRIDPDGMADRFNPFTDNITDQGEIGAILSGLAEGGHFSYSADGKSTDKNKSLDETLASEKGTEEGEADAEKLLKEVNSEGPGPKPGQAPNKDEASKASKTDDVINYTRIGTGILTVGNVLLNKRELVNLPKWFVGDYGRSIVMGKYDYTSVLSIQLRRLGWQHGGRIVGGAANAIYIGTTVYENVSYEKAIINGKQNFNQVQSHYDNFTVSPMFWLYKRIEPWLINLGK